MPTTQHKLAVYAVLCQTKVIKDGNLYYSKCATSKCTSNSIAQCFLSCNDIVAPALELESQVEQKQLELVLEINMSFDVQELGSR